MTSDSAPAARVPSLPGWRTSLLAVALLVAAVGAVEAAWRVRGAPPTVTDSPELWAARRVDLRLASAHGRPVALLGSSRVLWGLDVDTVREAAEGEQVFQLGLPGTSSTFSLEDLANDESFRGTAICGFLEEPSPEPARAQFAECLQLSRDGLGWRELWEIRTRAASQERLAILNSHCDWRRVPRRLVSGAKLWPEWYPVMRADRDVRADTLDPRYPRNGRPTKDHGPGAPGLTPKDWRVHAEGLLQSAKLIVARGGRVAFIRMPTSGDFQDRLEQCFPKSELWDPFVAEAAETAPEVAFLHWEDVPALAAFETPDRSHLDARDRVRFTAALIDELERRGAL